MEISVKIRSNKGITLVALVVTIVILLILAGVSINLVLGENGLIKRAQEASRGTNLAKFIEKVQMEITAEQAKNAGTEISASGLKMY